MNLRYAMNLKIEMIEDNFDDWETLLKLLHSAFSYQNSRIDPPSSLYLLNIQTLAEKAKQEKLYIALNHGELVGCIFAKAQLGSLYIGKFATWPSLQGKGIGKYLLNAVTIDGKRNGFSALELQVRIELTENQAAFAKLGFVQTGTTTHAGFKHATSVTMQKRI
jgi:GNAT superfamily N-acetyltransferase